MVSSVHKLSKPRRSTHSESCGQHTASPSNGKLPSFLHSHRTSSPRHAIPAALEPNLERRRLGLLLAFVFPLGLGRKLVHGLHYELDVGEAVIQRYSCLGYGTSAEVAVERERKGQLAEQGRELMQAYTMSDEPSTVSVRESSLGRRGLSTSTTRLTS